MMPPAPPPPPPGPDGVTPPPPPPPPPAMGRKPMMRDHSRLMFMAEGNGKGIVIADAVKKALDRFDAADTNKDGKLTPEERKAQRGAWRMKVS